ncbi:hypothetical protein WH47_06995 [Habropoda laboriosa]|uniref:Uncharacterized protein n=1 Tax=Habropoda laboriosa TaxID=597456 RepID=A0A0L7QRQ1_9HYME|nr:hypothetical protein WH47_06995 [Habropoda laboriosa]
MYAETVEERFMKLNKVLGLICGVWPRQNSRRKLITQILSLLLMASSIVTQIANTVLFFSMDNLVDGIPFNVAAVGTFVKLGNYIINETKLKSMVEQIFDDWTSITSETECKIMVTYARKGQLIALCYAAHLFLPAAIFLCVPFAPIILDIYAPLNKTRKRVFVYPAYYWMDPEQYYMIMIIHIMFVVIMVCVIFCACDMNYVYAVQHACGLLAVTRYLKHIEDSHRIYLFISMGMLMIAISVSLLTVEYFLVTVFLISLFLFCYAFHVFFLNVQGQFVINAFDELYDKIYESQWYNFTPRTQALYVLALRSCLNPPLLTAGGMTTLNLRSFAELARMLETLTVDVIVEQTPFFCPLVLLLCKQVNYIVNTDKFEYLLDSMCEDWNHERSYKEIGIMKKYGQRGNLLSRFYVVNAYICSFLFIQVPWSTRLVNSYKTQNITPSLQFVIPGYYFVDEVEYYYYIILHGTCTILIVVVVYCACDTSYMVLVQHTCGLFAVAGYRFKNSIREDNSVKGKYFDHWTKEAYKNACFSIQGHQRAINFVKEIERGHDTYLFTCLGLVILCFSITLIKLSTSDFDIDFYRYCSFTLCQLMHLFVIMLQGQFVLDSCERIHEAIYESLWYTSSSKTQALYVVALRRNLTPTCLTAGGLVQLNMQSFAEVAQVVCFFSLDVLIDQLSFFGAVSATLLKQGNYIVYKEEVNEFSILITVSRFMAFVASWVRYTRSIKLQYESLISGARNDWSIERPQGEIDIMTKYAERGAFLISTYLVNAIVCVILFVTTPVTPHILDILLPKNESRDVAYIYPAYYFTDEHKYDVYIITHMASVILVVFYVYVACDTSYIYVVQHGCGLLAVSGVILVKVSSSVRQLYRVAIPLIILRTISWKQVSNSEINAEFAKDCTFIVIQLVHILYLTLQGQFVIDANEEIFESIYSALWYNSDKRTQSLFVLALRNCLSAPQITAGGLITMNLQSFSEFLLPLKTLELAREEPGTTGVIQPVSVSPALWGQVGVKEWDTRKTGELIDSAWDDGNLSWLNMANGVGVVYGCLVVQEGSPVL